jgi:DtxR family manganese transport transcriptional regulator
MTHPTRKTTDGAATQGVRHHGGPQAFARTRKDHAQELSEDYVELIDDLILQHGEARTVDIAERLGVSHVTVNKTVARLKRDGLIIKRPYRSVFLTDEGQALAEACRLRHEIVYNFLRAIGVPREQAQIDSEGIEHHISEKTLRAMERFVEKSRAAR